MSTPVDHQAPAPRAHLPIDPLLPAISQALRERRNAVVQAAPGAGKTTRIPPALLAAGLAGSGDRIIVLEPRRVAVRAAAGRMAVENGWRLGNEVGYRIRFEARDSAATRILVVTEGVLLAMLQSDPLLDGIAVVIFDEFHERRLDADLALAMIRRVQREVREDLAVLVMSATLDIAPIAAFLGDDRGDAPVIQSRGRAHPVRIAHHAPAAGTPLATAVRAGVERALGEQNGDVLAFLPGVGEISRAAKSLAAWARSRDIDVVELYGDLASERQDRALETGPRRRIVLATNVAETSVTVAGVASVVDSGLARILRYDPASGLDRLEVRRIARASADQRSGRAGRLGPGLAVRLWSAHEDRGLRPRESPEITRVDLASAVLQLLAWGETDPSAFPWFEAPEAPTLEFAVRLLEGLGAVGRRGVTRRGLAMAKLGLHPRLARLLVAGHDAGSTDEFARVAALLSERDVVQRGRDGRTEATAGSDSDVLDRLDALADFARSGWGETPAGPLDRGRARHSLRTAELLARRVRSVLGPEVEIRDNGRDVLLRALLAAYPDRVARRRAHHDPRAVMVGGRGVRLLPVSSVQRADLFVCVELVAGRPGERSEASVRQASAIDAAWLAEVGGGISTCDKVVFDAARARAVGRRQRCFDGLVLEEQEQPAEAAAAACCLAESASGDLAAALPLDDPAVSQFLIRVHRLREWLPELGFPPLDDAALCALLPVLAAGRRSFAELRRAPLLDCLRGTLDHRLLMTLDREAPEQIVLPSGKSLRLQYDDSGPPVLAARIQQLFGLAETPTVARGQVTVLVHLLAPNMRPQQITQDLASFWSNTYPLVRKELAGRYPKHAWPADPLQAQPAPERR